jgi:transglutaminase-like putative cysteine protease
MQSSSSFPGRAQLTRDELLQVRWLLGGGLTLLAAMSVWYAGIDAWLLTGAIAAGVLLGLARPDWPARIPRRAHRLAFPGIAAIFAADIWLTAEVLPAFARLDLLLLLYRGITYRRKRDDLQVIVLGLILVVVAGVLTVSPLFAVHLLAFTAVALALLLAITLSPEEKNQGTGRADQVAGTKERGGVPGWAQEVRWGRLFARLRAATDWRVVALGGGLLAGLVVLSAVLFLAIPRFQLEHSLGLDRFISRSARTGFSDTIRLGDVTDIQQDNGVAVSIDVPDRGAIPAAPYWRMLVLDDYRAGTFRMSPALRRSAFAREHSGTVVHGGNRRREGRAVYWTFYLESGVSRYLPLPESFGELEFREPQHFRVSRSLGLVAVRDDPVTMTAYRIDDVDTRAVRADPARAHDRNPRAPGDAMRRLELDAADRATLRRIDREVAGAAKERSAADFARRATAWLARHHAYSLQPKIPAGAGDPLVRWLAGDGGGHCELFAGSLVLLARAAGWPARVVTGFRGGTWNAYSNNFTLRNSDAHAWCELFDEARGGWVRADPTPGATAATTDGQAGEAACAGRTDRSWTARFDSLRVFWYRRIVSFDQRAQLETLRAVKDVTEGSGAWARAALERLGAQCEAWLRAPWSGRRWAGLLGIALVLAAGARLGWRYRFSIGRALGGRRRGDPVRVAAGRWLARLRARSGGDASGDAGVVAELQRLRYGARETWPEPTAVFRRARQVSRRRRGPAVPFSAQR